jgi:hypothetical protein
VAHGTAPALLRFLCDDIRTWIGDEAVAVRHLHIHQRRLVEDVLLADDPVRYSTDPFPDS